MQPPREGPEDLEVPDPDALAYRLVARESPLDRAVLHELIGRPKRYAELKPLLGDKNDHNLTVSLKRLQDWGLIERRTDARQEPAVHSYELTPLGIQVVLTIPAIQPIHESIARYERGQAEAFRAMIQERNLALHAGPAEKGALGAALLTLVEQAVRERWTGAGRAEPPLEEFAQKKAARRDSTRR